MDITATQQFIDTLRKLPDESTLDSEFFAPLYDFFEDAGASLLLSTPDDYYLLYFDLPEAIDDILPTNVSWLVEKDEKTISLTMFADGKEIQTYHTFHFANNPVNAYFFKSLQDSRTLTINFFAMMYGDIYKLKSIDFTLPQAILQQIE
ncbi:MAG: hypothetical protein GYA16_13050 [Spirochaetes bacterium]|nr:hypothetical protein [Spirochaetota bacterium]NMB65785.1 hypothetical protein [Spirochaetota bacterium]